MMNETNIKCIYHSKRDAITKCERCQKTVCVECKMVYQQKHVRSHNDHHHTYYTRHELCPPCYYDRNIKEVKSPKKYLYLLSGFISIIVSVWMFSFTQDFISKWNSTSIPGPEILLLGVVIIIIFSIGFSMIGIIKIVSVPKKISDFEKNKQTFLANIFTISEIEQKTSKTSQKNYCPTVGMKSVLKRNYVINVE